MSISEIIVFSDSWNDRDLQNGLNKLVLSNDLKPDNCLLKL